jgi:hypothetical protein
VFLFASDCVYCVPDRLFLVRNWCGREPRLQVAYEKVMAKKAKADVSVAQSAIA